VLPKAGSTTFSSMDVTGAAALFMSAEYAGMAQAPA